MKIFLLLVIGGLFGFIMGNVTQSTYSNQIEFFSYLLPVIGGLVGFFMGRVTFSLCRILSSNRFSYYRNALTELLSNIVCDNIEYMYTIIPHGIIGMICGIILGTYLKTICQNVEFFSQSLLYSLPIIGGPIGFNIGMAIQVLKEKLFAKTIDFKLLFTDLCGIIVYMIILIPHCVMGMICGIILGTNWISSYQNM